MKDKYDCIVVGSGLAGLSCALTLPTSKSVLVVCKERLADSASSLAQGGIAAVVEKDDNYWLHANDTLKAGSFHNKKSAVDILVSESPNAVDWLYNSDVPFQKKGAKYLPSLEAAHSASRIVHTSDFTGKDIIHALLKRVNNAKNITILENAFTTDLILSRRVCSGIKILSNNVLKEFYTSAVVLATGGAGHIYKWTTNPKTATGDGIAMAVRAGAKVSDMEFFQFHPTALKAGSSPLFLLSERLRGEGAHIVDKEGIRFAKELSPRDELSRSIFEKQKTSPVYLSMKHLDATFVASRFPNIYSNLLRIGYDLTSDVIPVTPAAHYLCGGVATDEYGRTSIKNLYAVGETASTGVHGANRLASNSLAEAVVYGRRAGKYIGNNMNSIVSTLRRKKIIDQDKVSAQMQKKITILRENLQKIMWQNVGIVRNESDLLKALSTIKKIQKDIAKFTCVHRSFYELKNIADVSQLVAEAAIKRKKSLGAHFRIS